MYTTEINKTGSLTSGQGIINIQQYAILHAGTFGLTVASTGTPLNINPVNTGYVLARMKQLVADRQQMAMHGQAAEFTQLGGKAGVVFNATLSFPGPVDMTVGSILATSALLNWGDVLIPGYNDIKYDVEVARASDSVVVKSATSLVPSQYSATGLIASTAYKGRVRTTWGFGNVSQWSTYSNFTTTP